MTIDGEREAAWQVSGDARRMLLEGLDEISLTPQHDAANAGYETAHPGSAPA